MSNELFKTIEAQGRLITELRAENEQLKWEAGSTLVDLREQNELLRVEFDNIKKLSQNLVDRYYSTESEHYDEYEENEKPQDHAFLVIKELDNLLNQ
jgi:regulator of replication initiation timing